LTCYGQVGLSQETHSWQPQLYSPSIVSNIYCPTTFLTTLSTLQLGLLSIDLLGLDCDWSGGSLLTATSTSLTHSQSCSALSTYLWPLSCSTQSLAIAYWSFPGCRASHGNLFVSLGRDAESQHFNLKPTFSIKAYHTILIQSSVSISIAPANA
jgi:hypothetical protein